MKKVELVYFVHGTTVDNESGRCTGWSPGELSVVGIRQAKELANLIDVNSFDVVFCSDLKRAVDTAEMAFENSDVSIILDDRLRECNYGEFNSAKEEERGEMKPHIDKPYSQGESYKEVEKRMRSFVQFLIVNKKTWNEAIESDWRNQTPKAWQPGWVYLL